MYNIQWGNKQAKRQYLQSLTYALVVVLVSFSQIVGAQDETATHIMTNVTAIQWNPAPGNDWIASVVAKGVGTVNREGSYQDQQYLGQTVSVYRAEDPNRRIELMHPLNGRGINSKMSINWSPDGYYLATASFEGVIALWDFTNQDQPSGRLLAQTDIYVPGTPIAGNSITMMQWSSDGKWLLVVAGWNWHNLAVYDLSLRSVTGPLLIGGETGTLDIDWSPDGQWIAAGDNGSIGIYAVNDEGQLGQNGFRVLSSPEPDLPLLASCVDWHPDGKQLLVVDAQLLLILVYDFETQIPISSRPVPVDLATCPRWSPDGRLIAYRLNDQVRTEAEFSSFTWGGTMEIVDAVTWEVLAEYRSSSSISLRSTPWSPDGTRIAFPDGLTVRPIAESETDAQAMLRGEGDPVISIQTIQPLAATAVPAS
jgi:WD40 repeat protein